MTEIELRPRVRMKSQTIEILRDGTTVGYIGTWMDRGIPVIAEMELLPEYRFQGIGTKALAEFERQTREQGVRKVELSYVMADAYGWWDKQGYREESRLRPGEDSPLWYKRLRAPGRGS